MLALAGTLAGCALSLTACSGDSDPADDEQSSGPVQVEITEEGGEVTASQDVVEAERGQDIELVVSSDAAGGPRRTRVGLHRVGRGGGGVRA